MYFVYIRIATRWCFRVIHLLQAVILTRSFIMIIVGLEWFNDSFFRRRNRERRARQPSQKRLYVQYEPFGEPIAKPPKGEVE